MEPKKKNITIWLIVIAVVALVILQSTLSGPHTENLTYSEFIDLLNKGKVQNVVLGKETITGTLVSKGLEGILPKAKIEQMKRYGKGQCRFVTARVDDPGLVSQLESAKVQFNGKVENAWSSVLLTWVVPILLFYGLWVFLMRGMGKAQGGLMSVGKSHAKVYVHRSTGVKFDDVAGIDEARDELMEVVDFLRDPWKYRRLGGKIPKGVLLVGEPGTGKTLLAKAVAGEASVPFFSLCGSDFVEMFVGVGAARVRDLFSQAQDNAPCIIFIDELDALGKARGISPVVGGHDEREQTLNQLLTEMDGFDTQKAVIIIGATNQPEILDPALLRPGRFDRKVALDRPDLKGREKILKVHTRQVMVGPDVDLSLVAGRTPGFVGADLANLVNEAALQAARIGKEEIGMADFDYAIDRLIGGLERKSRIMNPKEKEIVAYHEAGHALVAESRPRADHVAKISIIPRGIAALGYTQQQPTEDRYLMTKGELSDRLDVLLGGRVAEEIIFGDVSTGAQDDLQRATDLVRHMIMSYGMSESLGLATFEAPRQSLYLNVWAPSQKEYSEETARAIDTEIRKHLDEAHARVRKTLVEKRSFLESLATLLKAKEVVDRKALDALLVQTQ